MLIVERQQKILDLLKERKAAPVESLAEALAVSSSTVRRDVEALEAQGLVERTHGGVMFRGAAVLPAAAGAHESFAGRGAGSLALEERMLEQVEAKRVMAAAAGKLVEPGMTVFIDGGSTMHYCVGFIQARPLQVVTHSLTVALRFADDERVELLVLGGSHYPRTGVLVGPVAMQALAGLHMDLMLFSCAGVYENEVFQSSLGMAEVEKLAMKQAARKVLLADSSKFGRKSLAKVCGVEELDLVITDAGIEERWKVMLGERVRVAGGAKQAI